MMGYCWCSLSVWWGHWCSLGVRCNECWCSLGVCLTLVWPWAWDQPGVRSLIWLVSLARRLLRTLRTLRLTHALKRPIRSKASVSLLVSLSLVGADKLDAPKLLKRRAKNKFSTCPSENNVSLLTINIFTRDLDNKPNHVKYICMPSSWTFKASNPYHN